MTSVSSDSVFEEVREVVADVLEMDAGLVLPESRFDEDLDASSYDQLLLVMALEDDLGIEVSDDQAALLVTVGHAVDLVRSQRRDE